MLQLDIDNALMLRDDTDPGSKVNDDMGASMARNVVLYTFRFEENRSTVLWSTLGYQVLYFVVRMYRERMSLT